MPRVRTAHKFGEKRRTGDVLTDEQLDFGSLLLSPDVLRGLSNAGFEKPSPIQLKAIPLGRCGLDLIAQAKSGTGKTCVFSVIALENILLESISTQVLVLAPTREIAVQIRDVMCAIGCHMTGLGVHAFIGGIPVDQDKKLLKKCQIAVGSPGRIKSLIENKILKTDAIRLFILDEADKLLDESFQEQVNWIFSSLPSNKQVLALSATYPEYLAQHLKKYMRDPTFVRLSATNPALQGIKQFYCMVPFHPLPHKTFQEKVDVLLKLLSRLNFQQCLIFSNYQMRAQSLCQTLQRKGWPAAYIAGSQTQSQRLEAMEKLKQFQCRVLISTDLTARGIDAEHVNLVVNMDVPYDTETLLHRIGRAGRFGTRGVAVTFVARGDEEKRFRAIEKDIGVTVDQLPDHIPESLYTDEVLLNSSEENCIDGTKDTVEVEILHQETLDGNQGHVKKWETKKQDCSLKRSLGNKNDSASNCIKGEQVVNNFKEVPAGSEFYNQKSNFVSENTFDDISASFKATQNPNLWCTGGETSKEHSDGVKNECLRASGSEANAPMPPGSVTGSLSLHLSDREDECITGQEMLESSSENSSSSEKESLPPSEEFDKDFEEYLTKSFAQQLVMGSINLGNCDNLEEDESPEYALDLQMLGNAEVLLSRNKKCQKANRSDAPEKEISTNLYSRKSSDERSATHQVLSSSGCLQTASKWHSAYVDEQCSTVQGSCARPEETGYECYRDRLQPAWQGVNHTSTTGSCQSHSQCNTNELKGGHFIDNQNSQNFSWWNNPAQMHQFSPYNEPFHPHSSLRQEYNNYNYGQTYSLGAFPASSLNLERSQENGWEHSWRNAYFRQCSYVRAFLEMRFPRPYQYGHPA